MAPSHGRLAAGGFMAATCPSSSSARPAPGVASSCSPSPAQSPPVHPPAAGLDAIFSPQLWRALGLEPKVLNCPFEAFVATGSTLEPPSGCYQAQQPVATGHPRHRQHHHHQQGGGASSPPPPCSASKKQRLANGAAATTSQQQQQPWAPSVAQHQGASSGAGQQHPGKLRVRINASSLLAAQQQCRAAASTSHQLPLGCPPQPASVGTATPARSSQPESWQHQQPQQVLPHPSSVSSASSLDLLAALQHGRSHRSARRPRRDMESFCSYFQSLAGLEPASTVSSGLGRLAAASQQQQHASSTLTASISDVSSLAMAMEEMAAVAAPHPPHRVSASGGHSSSAVQQQQHLPPAPHAAQEPAVVAGAAARTSSSPSNSASQSLSGGSSDNAKGRPWSPSSPLSDGVF